MKWTGHSDYHAMKPYIEIAEKTEVDAINGSVSAYGRKVGCPTPMNDKVVEIIHSIESGSLAPSFDNLRLFAEV